MSLLMDALKKAEQDKRAAARRLKEALSDDLALQLEEDIKPQTNKTVQSEEIQDNQDVKANAPIEGLSLEPLGDDELLLEDGGSPMEESVEENDSVADDAESRVKEETDPEITVDVDQTGMLELTPDAPTDDTVQTVQMRVAETLDSGSDSYEYFSTTVSAKQLARDIGAGSPTPVAAQTVFTATSANQDNQVLRWSALLFSCCVITVSLLFLVFDYTVPTHRSIKSPLAAKDVEAQPQPIPIIAMPDVPASSTEIDSSLFTGEITNVIERINDTVVEKEQSESADETVNKNSADHLALTREKTHIRAENDENISVAEIVDKAALTLPDRISPEPELIRISRSTTMDRSSVLINQAYQEYLAGNYDAAEKKYRIVLENLPENRDALLGLAAIASRKGHVRQAYTNYLEVLRLYPEDSIAEAALINFNRDEDQVKNESILKTFIQREPENSFFYYSLGQLYAAQKRWPEAQQSFFSAYSIESSNPDYAFNLAVSLEHVDQQKSAIDYYNTALELTDNFTESFATNSFDRTVIASRIKELSGLADLQ